MKIFDNRQDSFEVFIHDWLFDMGLSCCSYMTQAAWMHLSCISVNAEPKGVLVSTRAGMARLAGIAHEPDWEKRIEQILDELEDVKTATIERDGDRVTLINNRIAKREEFSERRIKRQSPPQFWNEIRRRILDRDRNLCVYCGESASAVDHVIPRTAGGSHYDDNLVACCKPCNSKKGARTPQESGMG